MQGTFQLFASCIGESRSTGLVFDFSSVRNEMSVNRGLLRNPETGADKDVVRESVDRLRERVEHIESFSGPSLRTRKLRNEIARLEARLSGSQEPAGQSIDIYLETA